MAKPVNTGRVARQTLECARKLEAYTAFLQAKPMVGRGFKALVETQAEWFARGIQPVAHPQVRGVPVKLVLPL